MSQRDYNKYLLLPVCAVPVVLYAISFFIPLDANFGLQVFVATICITAFWAFLMVSAKRCHDRGKSAQFLAILLVPLVGWIWVMLELTVGPTRTGPNKYGDDPEWD